MDILPQPPDPRNPTNPSPLNAAIADLRSLLALATTTLTSSPFAPSAAAAPTPLLRCPCNPNHSVPPDSLFSHFVRCLRIDPVVLPSIAPPSSSAPPALRLPAPDPDADLCFSLDSAAPAASSASDFLYGDCPAVVTTPGRAPALDRTFSIPGFLASECGNYVGSCDGNCNVGLPFVRLLPSEFWLLKCEVGSWSGQPPGSYSYVVLRATSRLDSGVVDDEYGRWVVARSANFGVVIDSAVRDHLCVLVNLCAKAGAREACGELEMLQKTERNVDRTKITVMCPRLLRVMLWLGLQLSVLYGENNGRLLAVEMFKELILRSGSCLLVHNFYDSKGVKNGDGMAVESGDSANTGLIGGAKVSEREEKNVVYVSQVAAAIAALHLRFSLEERLRALRFGQHSMHKYQLIKEYTDAVARGNEERAKRPNFRPILEYDSIFLHRAQNQESGKAKTREELLAEERDYKRRRLSYRGKKVKRNATEVLRDIIDEHMALMRQAGGFDCGENNAVAVRYNFLESTSHKDVYSDAIEPQDNAYCIDEQKLEQSDNKSFLAVTSSNLTSRSHGWFHESRWERDGDYEERAHSRNEHFRWSSESENFRGNYSKHRESRRHNESSYNSQTSAYDHCRDGYQQSKHKSAYSDTKKAPKSESTGSNSKRRSRRFDMSDSEFSTQEPIFDRFDPSSVMFMPNEDSAGESAEEHHNVRNGISE